MNTQGITQRLIAKSDDDLRHEITTAFKPAALLLANGCHYQITIQPKGHEAHPDLPEIKVGWVNAFAALKEEAFNQLRDQRRQTAIDAFMARVEKLTDELEEIKSQAQ